MRYVRSPSFENGPHKTSLYQSVASPLSLTVTHSPIRIGVIHGHQCVPTGNLDSLNSIARQMDVDVLISGHTHTYGLPVVRERKPV
jgi:putative phosphoesterase